MSQSTIRRTWPGVVRVLACSLLLSALFAACLYLYHTAFPFFREHLLETDKKTTAWFVKQLSFSLPFLVMCLFLAIAYRGSDRRDGVAAREKMWIVITVTALTYCVLLPLINHQSKELYEAAVAAGAEIPETDGKVPWTLMMKLHDWFIRLPIPMALLTVFFGVRSARERREPDEPEEPLLTVDEYNARMAAENAPEEELPHG